MEAQRALAFARLHDWGEGAYLEGDQVRGLLDAYTQRQPDGSVTYHEEEASCAAFVRAKGQRVKGYVGQAEGAEVQTFYPLDSEAHKLS